MKNLRQLKDLIKNMSKEMDINAQILLRNYMLERHLERVSLSEFRQKVVDVYLDGEGAYKLLSKNLE